MGEQRIRHDVAAETDGIECAAEIDRVPQHDGRRDQGEAARAMSLGLGGAIVEPPEAMEADGASQGIVAFALVEFGRGLASERGLLQPVQGVQGPLDAADLAQREGEAVLAGVGAQPL